MKAILLVIVFAIASVPISIHLMEKERAAFERYVEITLGPLLRKQAKEAEIKKAALEAKRQQEQEAREKQREREAVLSPHRPKKKTKPDARRPGVLPTYSLNPGQETPAISLGGNNKCIRWQSAQDTSELQIYAYGYTYDEWYRYPVQRNDLNQIKFVLPRSALQSVTITVERIWRRDCAGGATVARAIPTLDAKLDVALWKRDDTNYRRVTLSPGERTGVISSEAYAKCLQWRQLSGSGQPVLKSRARPNADWSSGLVRAFRHLHFALPTNVRDAITFEYRLIECPRDGSRSYYMYLQPGDRRKVENRRPCTLWQVTEGPRPQLVAVRLYLSQAQQFVPWTPQIGMGFQDFIISLSADAPGTAVVKVTNDRCDNLQQYTNEGRRQRDNQLRSGARPTW